MLALKRTDTLTVDILSPWNADKGTVWAVYHFPEAWGLPLTRMIVMFIFSKASRCYQKAFDLDPSCDDAGIALGDSLMELGQEVNWHESAE